MRSSRIPRAGYRPAVTALALSMMPVAASLSPLAAQDTTDVYRVLTNTPRSSTNFNVETIRGLAYDETNELLYAINTHGSMLMRFDPQASSPLVVQPLAEWRTLNNPSALALWVDDDGNERALVVGGGTHGIAMHDLNTGAIVGYRELPSEPMDIVVDPEDDIAFVSCAGAYDDPAQVEPYGGGVVVEIPLDSFDTGTILEHFIDGARPTFLNLDYDEEEDNTYVYVTPQLSGNRTSWTLDAWVDGSVVAEPGLPDEDLFRLEAGGSVKAVETGLGTILTNHGRNPATGDYWVLNVDSLNAAAHTEAGHRGMFAENRVSIVASFGSGSVPMSLDGTVPATPITADKPASFPFGLAFEKNGYAFVASSTGDVVRLVDLNGVSLHSFGLDDGAIPRGLLLSPGDASLFVYAWGTNQILRYDAQALINSPGTAQTAQRYDLGADPQPQAVKDGREIWYDADNSFDAQSGRAGKVTCNTCHPRGGLDMLGWELGDPPNDRKDLMITQSLLSIEDSFPYHWRGERTLSDFNGAFDKLLGGSVLGVDDLADFEAFVFSLQAPANPRQDKDRMVNEEKTVARFADPFGGPDFIGSVIEGQNIFYDDPAALTSFNPSKCVDCHSPESGSNGLIMTDLETRFSTNANIEVAHLRQLHHKLFQPVVNVGGNVMRPRGGFGISQDGDDNTIFDLLHPAVFFNSVNPIGERLQRIADAASFVAQFDQGIAPRAHSAVLFDFDHATMSEVQNLLNQAEDGWIDVAAVGIGFGIPMGLWYNVDDDQFYYAETSLSPGATLGQLNTYRQSDQVRFLFVGLPPGNGFRFAVDHDDDDLSNLYEIQPSVALDPQDPDWDDDGLPDGYEVQTAGLDPKTFNATSAGIDTSPPDLAVGTTEVFDHVTGRLVKLFLEFKEPVTYTVRVLRKDSLGNYVPIGSLQQHSALRRSDTLVAHELVPGFNSYVLRDDRYRLEVELKDLAGLTNTLTFPSSSPTADYESRKAVVLSEFVEPLVVSSLSIAHTAGSATISATVDVDDLSEGATALGGGPAGSFAGGKNVILQLLQETSPGSDEFVLVTTGITPTSPSTLVPTLPIGPFTTPPVTYGTPASQVPGPFLVSDLTGSTGTTTVTFDVSGITAGTRVRVVVLGILRWEPTFGFYFGPSIRNWQMPMTANDARAQTFPL